MSMGNRIWHNTGANVRLFSPVLLGFLALSLFTFLLPPSVGFFFFCSVDNASSCFDYVMADVLLVCHNSTSIFLGKIGPSARLNSKVKVRFVGRWWDNSTAWEHSIYFRLINVSCKSKSDSHFNIKYDLFLNLTKDFFLCLYYVKCFF